MRFLFLALAVQSGCEVTSLHAGRSFPGDAPIEIGFEIDIPAPPPGTRAIYVSSSQGEDTRDGSSPLQAVRSLEQAHRLLRPGSNDWLLLRRGDRFSLPLRWSKSGVSASAPMVVASYGSARDGRPVLAGMELLGSRVEHVRVRDLHFEAASAADLGISSQQTTLVDVQFERNKISGFSVGASLFDSREFASGSADVRWVRNVLTNNGRTLYLSAIEDLELSENLFVSNREGAILDPYVSRARVTHNLFFMHVGTALNVRGSAQIEANVFFQNGAGLNVTTSEVAVEHNAFLEMKETLSNQGHSFCLTINPRNSALAPARGPGGPVRVSNNLFGHRDPTTPSGSPCLKLTSNVAPEAQSIVIEENVFLRSLGAGAVNLDSRFTGDLFHDSVLFRGNAFVERRPFLAPYGSPMSSNIRFERNRYDSDLGALLFLVGARPGEAREVGFSDWIGVSRELAGQLVSLGLAATAPQLRDYWGAEPIATRLEAQGERSWDPAFSADRMLDFMRVGFSP